MNAQRSYCICGHTKERHHVDSDGGCYADGSGSHGYCPCQAFMVSDVETKKAQVRTAAPDLLEATQELIRVWEGPRERAAFEFAAAIVKAKAAIAKATKTE